MRVDCDRYVISTTSSEWSCQGFTADLVLKASKLN